jgi:membrane-associated phospholipid phosphatase
MLYRRKGKQISLEVIIRLVLFSRERGLILKFVNNDIKKTNLLSIYYIYYFAVGCSRIYVKVVGEHL